MEESIKNWIERKVKIAREKDLQSALFARNSNPITEVDIVNLTRSLTEAQGEKMKKVVMVDMDDTLTDASWRKKFLPQNGGSWDQFHANATRDMPTKMVAIVNELSKQYDIVISTAKPIKWMDDVRVYLNVHANFKPVKIFMREDLNITNPQVKARHANILADQEIFISLAIDDRIDVCKMYMDRGIPAILVDKKLNIIEDEVIHSSESAIRQAAEDFGSGKPGISGTVQPAMATPEKETPDEILRSGADFFEERNKEYGYAYLKHGKIMAEFFPNGIELATVEDFFKFHLFELDIIKSNRIAEAYRKNTDHEDSWYDKMVYAAMAKSEIKPKTGE